MGIKAHLARELQTMLTSNAGDKALAIWLRKNGKVVHDSLDAMDDMVEIEEIDLQDMVQWAKARGVLKTVPTAPRRR